MSVEQEVAFEPLDQKAYDAGHQCRREYKGKNACPYGPVRMKLRHFWLSGWVDADIEAIGGLT